MSKSFQYTKVVKLHINSNRYDKIRKCYLLFSQVFLLLFVLCLFLFSFAAQENQSNYNKRLKNNNKTLINDIERYKSQGLHSSLRQSTVDPVVRSEKKHTRLKFRDDTVA